MKEISKDDFDWFDEEIDTTNNVGKLRNPFRVYDDEYEERAYLERKEQEKYKKFSEDELENYFWNALINLYYLDEKSLLLEDIKELLIKHFPNYDTEKYDIKPKQVIDYIDYCMFSIGEDKAWDYIIDKEMDEYEKQHAEEYPEKYYYEQDSGEYIEY